VGVQVEFLAFEEQLHVGPRHSGLLLQLGHELANCGRGVAVQSDLVSVGAL
jgi:hypothetical protein